MLSQSPGHTGQFDRLQTALSVKLQNSIAVTEERNVLYFILSQHPGQTLCQQGRNTENISKTLSISRYLQSTAGRMNLTGKHLPVQHLRQINNRRLLLCMFPDVIKTFLFRRTNITVCSIPITFTAIKQFLPNESHIRFHRTMLCITECIKCRGHRNINRNGQFDTLGLYGQRYINIKVHIPMHTVLN